jgi:hypothetical protein
VDEALSLLARVAPKPANFACSWEEAEGGGGSEWDDPEDSYSGEVKPEIVPMSSVKSTTAGEPAEEPEQRRPARNRARYPD